MDKRKKILQLVLLLLVMVPVWSCAAWFFQIDKPLNIIIIDKSVNTLSRQEHRGFSWVINAERYVKHNKERYKGEKDYYGFSPLSDDPMLYRINDVEKLSLPEIEKLGSETDLIYLADVYGIYHKQWQFKEKQAIYSSVVYGGLTSKEMHLLQAMKKKGKTILAEFNTFGPPTADSIRNQFEETFGVKWSGWAGRYFDLLDTVQNRELPRWVVKLYTHQHGGNWPFKNAGIVFVNKDGKLFILENKVHLNVEVPFIHTMSNRQAEFQQTDSVHFPFWFDITYATGSSQIVAYYSLNTTAEGDALLNQYGLPHQFPAVIEHKGQYTFYYFAGDFANCPVSPIGSYLKGIERYQYFLYSESYSERTKFFWRFYRPVLSKILSNRYKY